MNVNFFTKFLRSPALYLNIHTKEETHMATSEERIQRLEDIAAIKDLKNRYARMCNDNHNWELIPTIFAPDCE